MYQIPSKISISSGVLSKLGLTQDSIVKIIRSSKDDLFTDLLINGSFTLYDKSFNYTAPYDDMYSFYTVGYRNYKNIPSDIIDDLSDFIDIVQL